MSEYTLFVQRIGLAGVAQAVIRFRGLIILPILTKTLGASDYGIWSQILVTVAVLQPLIQLGLPYSILRLLPSKEKRAIGQGIITALSVIFLTGTAAAILAYLSSDFLAGTLLKDADAAVAIRLGSLLIILEALNATALGSFRIFGYIKRYATVAISQAALEVGLISLMVFSGQGILGAITALIITRGIVFIIMLTIIFLQAGFSPPDFSSLPAHLRYGLPLVPTAIFALIVSLTDRYVIGYFLGASSVGIYSAAYGIGNVIMLFGSYITYILSPTIFRLYDRGRLGEVKTYLSYSWKYLLILAIPAAFGLSVLAEPLLRSLTTVEFVQAGRFIVPLVAFGTVFYAVYAILGEVVRLSRRTAIFPLTFGIAAILNLGLNILLVPHWGIMAAAFTTLIAYLMVAIIMYCRARRELKFGLKPGSIIKSIIASIVMGAILWFIKPDSIAATVLSIVAGAVIYFTTFFLLRGFDRNEIHFFLTLIKESTGIIKR